LKMAVCNKSKPLAYLMKSVNPDKYSINDCPRKKNKVLDYLT
jgi:hypothetical protein